MRYSPSRISAFLGAREFLFGISLTALFGVALVVVGDTGLVWGSENAWRQLLAGLGDALVIAAVLALLVDPVAQIRFARRWGRDIFWAIFNPRAPETFREALKDLAAQGAFDRTRGKGARSEVPATASGRTRR